MEWFFIILISLTTIIYLLHKLFENKNNKFANFINKIWNEWFEEQWNAIVGFIIVMSIIAIIVFLIYCFLNN